MSNGHRRLLDHERGLSESVQLALLLPLILLTLLATIQGAVWLHGRNAVTNAAIAAAEVQAMQGSCAGSAQGVATRIAEDAGLTAVTVHTGGGAETVTVTVAARVPLVIDVDREVVQAPASRPREG